jgi:protein involved in polysaccharide export with SLBB domain
MRRLLYLLLAALLSVSALGQVPQSEQGTRVVYVVGDVQEPGGYEVKEAEATLLKMITLAQGFNKTANLNAVRIVRKMGDAPGRTEIPIDIAVIEGSAPDVPVLADDVIFVPSTRIRGRSGLILIASKAPPSAYDSGP